MKHHASQEFWSCYKALPGNVQALADKNFALLKANPQHPSLHLKKVGDYWSCRVGLAYRALGFDVPDGLLWFWIGSHADYDQLVARR